MVPGKVAFVTGASVEPDCARVRAGRRKCDHHQPSDRAAKFPATHSGLGVQALAITCDITQAEEVKAARQDRIEDIFWPSGRASLNDGVEQPITAAADVTEQEWTGSSTSICVAYFCA